MHVVLDGLAGGFGGCREEGADVDVEAEIRERRGDHLLAAIVAVLADLGDQDARPPALVGFELRDLLEHALDRFRHGAGLPFVDARDRLDRGDMAAKDLFQRQRDFADRGLGARGLDGEREEIAVTSRGRTGEGIERRR